MMADAIRADDSAIGRSALLVAALSGFLSPFSTSSVHVALPSMAREFRIDAVLLGWVTTGYLLAQAMFLVPCGKAADIYGRKRIFTYGMAVFTVASAALAISDSGSMLISLRILQGIGSASIYSVGAAILTSVFPVGEIGKVLGIHLGAVYIGYSSGPFFGGLLTHYIGWRSIFLVNVILGAVVISLIFWRLKGEWHEAEEETFDMTGSILFGLSLLSIMYGFSQLTTMLGALLVLFGILGMLAFIKWEGRARFPVLDISLFRRNRVFAFSNLGALISYAATYAVTFLLSLYLQYIKGLTPENAGLVLVCQPIMQAIFSPFSGRLSDRVEPRIVASIGMALTAVGLFFLTSLDERTALGFVVATLIVLGFGFSLFSSPNSNAVMRSVEKRFYGVASGTVGVMRAMGMVFSMGITILVFSIYIGEAQITPESYPLLLKGTKLTFLFFGVLCVGGILASLARGNVR